MSRELLNNTFGGKGAIDTPQGEVEIAAKFNKKFAASLLDIGVETRTVFPVRNPAVLSIFKHEIVYRLKTDASSTQHQVKILSSLNGHGSKALELFPADEALQTEAIFNDLLILGTAFDDVHFDPKKTTRDDLSFQIKGVFSGLHAKQPMHQGLHAEYYIPTPTDLESLNRVAEPHREAGKVLIELRPFNSQLAGQRIITHIREVLYDTNRWKQAMNPKYRSTLAWLAMSDGFFQFSLLSGLLFMDRFGPSLIKVSKDFATGGDTGNLTEAEKSTFRDRLLVLASRLGVLDANVNIRGLVNSPEDLLLIREDDAVEELKRNFLGSVFFDGRIAEHGFGFTSPDQPLPGTSQEGLDLTDPYGNFLHKQINIPTIFMSSVVQGVRNAIGRIAGKITRGVSAGQIFSWIA